VTCLFRCGKKLCSLDVLAIILSSPSPSQSGIVRDAIKKRRRLRIPAKVRDGFPNREQDFLHQIIAVIAFGKSIDEILDLFDAQVDEYIA